MVKIQIPVSIEICSKNMSYVKSWWNKMIYLHDILGHTIKPPECHYLALSPTNENFLATPFLTGPDVVAALLAAVLSAEVTAMDARRDSRSIRVAMVANDGRESMRVERRRRELCLKLDKQLTTRNLSDNLCTQSEAICQTLRLYPYLSSKDR